MAIVMITWEWSYSVNNKPGFWLREHFWLEYYGQRWHVHEKRFYQAVEV